ncbi:transposase family protein [Streptomyces sp. NPDC006251]|uniref:transposase family protein n=1 Tax=Streptomyces sp. NPDC006251 TaxID=3155718 RepID=UPI0033A7B100
MITGEERPSRGAKALTTSASARSPAEVPDPRDPRGVRHRLAVVLSLTACAVPAGATSLPAVGAPRASADGPPRPLPRRWPGHPVDLNSVKFGLQMPIA